MLDTYGRTGQQFLEELFAEEYCCCCGGDVADHTPVPMWVQSDDTCIWFARCDKELED